MGLFGSKKTYVSAVVYNMAGDKLERINYLKTVVVGSTISNTRFSMAECIGNNYLGGPGIKIRSFHRWSRESANYGIIGVPEVNIYSPGYNTSTITANIPVTGTDTNSFKSVTYGPGEYSYWAEQWVMANHQDRVNFNWVSTYDAVAGTITIHWDASYGLADETFSPGPIDNGSNYYYTVYERRTSSGNFVGSFMWIYKVGSGNTAMDSMPVANPVIGEFITFIPVRMGNEFISTTFKPEVYPYVKKAYKKATGGKKLDDLNTLIADNPDLGDIDRAFVAYGVSLNHPDRACRRYLFKFFDFLRTAQVVDDAAYTSYTSSFSGYSGDENDFTAGRHYYLRSISDGGLGGDPGGTSDPSSTGPSPAVPTEPINEIDIKSNGTYDANFHMRMKWNSITKTSGAGIKPGAPAGTKKGDVWWGTATSTDFTSQYEFINAIIASAETNDQVDLTWQLDDDYWETLTIKGLKHKNIIKNGESVVIRAGEALADTDESAFLVPIHYETMRSMSLVDSTQMMTCSTYIVFTCYEVVKQKWYQTGIFKIIVFVVLIAITVVTGGAGAIGLLGTAGAVGASLGFVGLMATIVGAIANALAAMILSAVLQFVGTAVFGAKFGAIIAAVAGAIAMSVGSGLMAGQSMSAMWGNMMSVTNIIHMTSAVGGGISGYLEASAESWATKTQSLVEQYEKESKRIQEMYLKEFGQGDFHFDPNWLTNTDFGGVTEIPQSFLDRTLLTGGDIAEMSLNMVTDFADMTLNLNTSGS